MSIDRGSGVPPWKQLAAILRGQIERGEITGRLPGEVYLTQEYGMALKTVRKAMAHLREEGVITTTPGMGSFVRRTEGE